MGVKTSESQAEHPQGPKGQIKGVTAGAPVRSQANTRTRLLLHSIVPVPHQQVCWARQPGLPNRARLDLADTGSLPFPWPPGTIITTEHTITRGWGMSGKAGLVLDKALGASQLCGWALGTSHIPYKVQAGFSYHHKLTRYHHKLTLLAFVGSTWQSGVGTSPPRSLLWPSGVRRVQRAKHPISTSTLRLWDCSGSKQDSHCPAEECSQISTYPN